MKKILTLALLLGASFGLHIRQTNIAQHALKKDTIAYVGTNDRPGAATNLYATNGGSYVFISTNSPWTLNFDSTTVGDGTNIITFLIRSFTNISESNVWQQTNIFDNSPPVVALTNITNLQILTRSVFTFRGTNFENYASGMSNIVATVTNSNGTVVFRSNMVFTNDVANTNNHLSLTYNFVNFVSGTYTFSITATNNAGTVATNNTIFQFAAVVPTLKTQAASPFFMGNPTERRRNKDEFPVHAVYLPAYAISTTEVSYIQYDDVVAWATNNGYTFNGTAQAGSSNRTRHTGTNDEPAAYVSWYDAILWCNALSERSGFSPVYRQNDGTIARAYQVDSTNVALLATNGYRLPSEAEWEYSYKGNVVGDFINGVQLFDRYAWYVKNTSYTRPVATVTTNTFGLYDFAGNVQEWCYDVYTAYTATNQTSPYHGNGTNTARVVRGGSYKSGSWDVRAQVRQSLDPRMANFYTGFRVVRCQ